MMFNKGTLATISALVAMSVVPAMAQEAKTATPWTDKVKIGGFMRNRHHWDKETSGKGRELSRHRVLARLMITGDLTKEFQVGLRLATGELGGGSAVNGGHTDAMMMDGRKDFTLDRVFLQWKPNSNATVQMGKMPYQYYQAGGTSILASDAANYEGFQGNYSLELGGIKPSIAAGHYTFQNLNAATSAGATTNARPVINMYAAQLNVPFNAGPVKAIANVFYSEYVNLKGNAFASGTSYRGNRSTGGNYTNDFKIVAYAAEANVDAGFAPVRVFGQYTTNSGASDENISALAGIRLGETRQPGSWHVEYSYRDIAMDAVFAHMNDNGFLGGGSDSFGHQTRIGYQIASGLALSLSRSYGEKSGRTAENHQLDLNASF